MYCDLCCARTERWKTRGVGRYRIDGDMSPLVGAVSAARVLPPGSLRPEAFAGRIYGWSRPEASRIALLDKISAAKQFPVPPSHPHPNVRVGPHCAFLR